MPHNVLYDTSMINIGQGVVIHTMAITSSHLDCPIALSRIYYKPETSSSLYGKRNQGLSRHSGTLALRADLWFHEYRLRRQCYRMCCCQHNHRYHWCYPIYCKVFA
jgi:hypothetical protein